MCPSPIYRSASLSRSRHAIIDTVRDPLLVLDENQRITAVSRSFYQTFDLPDVDLRGKVLFDIDGGHWNIRSFGPFWKGSSKIIKRSRIMK